MTAEIISIGFELLNGRTVNTNATYIARELTAIGYRVNWISTVEDEADSILSALDTAVKRADVVISTGGLGPTNDDITKKVVSDFFGSRLVMDENILEKVRRRFVNRGLQMPDINTEQALIPDKAIVLNNTVGTAPGLMFEQKNVKVFVLPGVPAEMRELMKNEVIPRLKHKNSDNKKVLSFKTIGITESGLYERVNPILKPIEDIETMYYPDYSGVELKIMMKNPSEKRIDNLRSSLYQSIGMHIISENPNDSILTVLAEKLKERKHTLAVAESCTGGLLGELLTSLSGSSRYFQGGMITYSNEAKIQLLGIPEEVIRSHGAVSELTAENMANRIREKFQTTWGIGITGIAGPEGGTEEKPVGLVYVGLSGPQQTQVKRYLFGANREVNRQRAAYSAMAMLLKRL